MAETPPPEKSRVSESETRHDSAAIDAQANAGTEQEKEHGEGAATEQEQQQQEQQQQQQQQDKKQDAPYSIRSVREKRLIVVAASLAGFFSPLSASIYYPALPAIAESLNVSETKVNLTVTTFLIIQGVAPMMIAGFSDSVGRRPAYAICFVIYMVANLALALQDSYAALMVLRCLQSAGSSGAIAIANGVVSDIITPAERGGYIAFASMGSILGPTLSPIIGGLLAQYLDWHWIFWFLLIFTGAFCIPFFLFFPETCRNVVGNGSIPPPPLNRCLTDILHQRRREKASTAAADVEAGHPPSVPPPPARKKIVVPNPLKTLVVFSNKQTALILVPAGVAFGTFYGVLTGASGAFKDKYHFSSIQVALMFLPLGAGGLISALTTGKLVDRNFRRHARRRGIAIVRNRRQDLTDFPVELARLQVALPLFWTGTAAMIIYGWVIGAQVNLAGPIILLLAMSWTLAAFYQVLNVLLVDTYPGRGAVVTACVNLIRCELGAAAAAVISPMTDSLGTGWAYTIIALIGLATTPLLMLTTVYGIRWRREMKERQQRRDEREVGKREEKERRVEEKREARDQQAQEKRQEREKVETQAPTVR